MPSKLEIVYVEDDAPDRQHFRDTVAPHFNNPVTYLESAEDLLARLPDGAPDQIRKPGVILVDAVLPGISGYDLVKLLREDYKHLDLTPLIIVTGSNDRSSKSTAKSAGADWYLAKPVSYFGLLDALRGIGFFMEIVDRRPSTVADQ